MERNQRKCFVYCMTIASKKVKQGDTKGAEIYIENAMRSLRELKKMKEERTHVGMD